MTALPATSMFIGRAQTVRTSDPLVAEVLGRSRSVFEYDLEKRDADVRDCVKGTRVLVIGAAGSIGGAFVRQLLPYQPASLHLCDLSENGMVELVRSIRASDEAVTDDFRTFCIDMRLPEMDSLLKSHGPYDHVLNFAALKHVRSERDPFTLGRMLDTNVLAVERLLRAIGASPTARVFSVSSDKAVRPGNLMGASKALMERVMAATADRVSVTSARFANVAFSSGSLLAGFLRRLEQGQPLAAPVDIKRWFISHEEAGQLCLLAAFLGDDRELLVPRPGAVALHSFDGIARQVLAFHGLIPEEHESEDAARSAASRRHAHATSWPCFFSKTDTAGEKPVEEFTRPEEAVVERYSAASIVRMGSPGPVSQLLGELGAAIETFDLAAMHAAVRRAVPELAHVAANKDLDQKM